MPVGRTTSHSSILFAKALATSAMEAAQSAAMRGFVSLCFGVRATTFIVIQKLYNQLRHVALSICGLGAWSFDSLSCTDRPRSLILILFANVAHVHVHITCWVRPSIEHITEHSSSGKAGAQDCPFNRTQSLPLHENI